MILTYPRTKRKEGFQNLKPLRGAMPSPPEGRPYARLFIGCCGGRFLELEPWRDAVRGLAWRVEDAVGVWRATASELPNTRSIADLPAEGVRGAGVGRRSAGASGGVAWVARVVAGGAEDGGSESEGGDDELHDFEWLIVEE